MNEFYLILNQKAGQIDASGELLKKITMEEDVNFENFDVGLSNTLDHFILAKRKEIAEYVLEKGIEHLLSVQNIAEAIVTAGAPQSLVIQIMTKFLSRIDVEEELIIIDPYFFAPTQNPNYVSLVKEILLPFLGNLSKIRIVTIDRPSKIDLTLKGQIYNSLLAENPALQISHHQTDHFHDRFWISGNREKGVLTGTSLNGLGNRFALIDRLNKTDVRDIVSELNNFGFLT